MATPRTFNYSIIVTMPNGRQEVIDHLGRPFIDRQKAINTANSHVASVRRNSEYRGATKIEVAIH